ncbi:MAG: aspartate/glutamate racemase family protein [Geminicoccaceae bacterium]
MKTLGLIGGMSWESTALYYQRLNQLTRARRGGLHSAPLLLYSFDFAEIERLQADGDWRRAGDRLAEVAQTLEHAGAQALVLCTNTMHKLAAQIEAATAVPLLHIADATAAAIERAGVQRPLLLATAYTMEQDFYTGRLREGHGIDVVVPDPRARALIHQVIYDELCQGRIEPASKARYLAIIERAVADGADGVIFGCTEVGLLIQPDDLAVRAFDTTELHCHAAIAFALG